MYRLILSFVLSIITLMVAVMPAVADDTGTAATTSTELPPSLQFAMSRVLGTHDTAYFAQGTGLPSFTNTRQNMTVQFAPNHVSFSQADANWTLQLHGVGYGNDLVRPASAHLDTEKNRVSYMRENLIEWYINGPAGIQQGVTVLTAPQGNPDDELTVAFNSGGTLHATQTDNTLTLADATGRTHLMYSGLIAFDARGRTLPARMNLVDGRLLWQVDDTDAIYPVTIDPLVSQTTLQASDTASNDWFGYSVDIDGDTVVVGAPQNDDAGTSSGSAYVFVEPAGGWSASTALMNQAMKLVASDAEQDALFGYSVSVDGDTIVVGAYNQRLGSGSGYVYVEPAIGWVNAGTTMPTMTETVILAASDRAEDKFLGYSVDISGDTVVLGATGDSPGGSAYVYVEPAAGWDSTGDTLFQAAKLQPSDNASGDFFGHNVSIDGDTIVAGAPEDDTTGSAYVFTRPPGGWSSVSSPISYTTKLIPSDAGSGDRVGEAVAISGDTVVVGAPFYDDDTQMLPESGAAYVFLEPSGGWAFANLIAESARLAPSTPSQGELFGYNVHIDGQAIAVISAPWAAAIPLQSDSMVYVFMQPSTGWAGNPAVPLTATYVVNTRDDAHGIAVHRNTVIAGIFGQEEAAVYQAPMLTVELSDSTITDTEGDSGTSTGSLFLRVTGDVTSLPRSIDLVLSDGSATQADNDYSQTQATITLPAGDYTMASGVSLSVDQLGITGDTIIEPDESFTVTLQNPVGFIETGDVNGDSQVDSTAIYTIANDDSATLSIDDVTADESGNFDFTVTLSDPVPNPVQMAVTTIAGTATSGDDYTAIVGGTVAFAANDTTPQTITVSVIDDAVIESDETFEVLLSNISSGGLDVTFADDRGLGTIVDDDDYDLNDDGFISPVDAIYIINRLGTPDLSADLDGDDAVTISDLQLILDRLGP